MEKYSELGCSFKENAKCTGKEKFISFDVASHIVFPNYDNIDSKVKRCIHQEAHVSEKVDDVPKFIEISNFALSKDLDHVECIQNRINTEESFDEPFIISFGLYVVHYEA